MLKSRPIQQVIISVIVIAFLASFFIFFQTSRARADLQKAPLNPAFIKWQNQQAASSKVRLSMQNSNIGEKRFYGLTPSPLNFSHLKRNIKKTDLQSRKHGEPFPATYDLRTLNKLSPVKSQDPYGTCWAFATMATIESYLMPLQDWDFSEKQFAYIAYSGDDGFTPDPAYGLLDQGGDMWKATALLARWSSPVNEVDVPYGDEQPFPKKPVQIHLKQAFYLPNLTENTHSQFNFDNIKSAVMSYGAISIGMNYDDGPEFFNDSNYAYYYDGEEPSNHEVNIVGWDDSFSKKNFGIVPAGNGAWIVRNNWGEEWGDYGYFYISYYDTAIDDGVAFVVEDVNNYDNNYQYDPLGWTASIGNGELAMFANIFTAGSDEVLEAVGFYVPTNNVEYHLYVFTDCLGVNGPQSGKEAMAPQDGTFNIAGYHTVPLVSPVDLQQGQTFSVVVYIKTPGYEFPIPVEAAVEDYSDNARAQAGQSYISYDLGATWTDLVEEPGYEQANVCVKAFTSKADLIDCLLINGKYDFIIPCAEYDGVEYGFTLRSTDLLNWEMDLNSLKTVSGQGRSLTFADNLNLEIPSVEFNGLKYQFTLKYIKDLNWFLDVESLKPLQ